ncbi:hypothetical protein BY458DRAFT_553136 [Sporodiniella umbellata]|nr:hypothetical protein BY458DRAFT_553136 [Sporodiniella umbellata]
MDDFSSVDIHSVANLMQAALWSTSDRIISKKTWREINYETCQLSDLSQAISKKKEAFLIEILDFLVELLRYKQFHEMSAYDVGDALGKVVLGPEDCSQIMEEKSGHFLTRLVIERAQGMSRSMADVGLLKTRADSGYGSFSWEKEPIGRHPIGRWAGTEARAKFYRRTMAKTQGAKVDWLDHAEESLQCLLDNNYRQQQSDGSETAWVSIFSCSPKDLSTSEPIMARIIRGALKPAEAIPQDPLANSFLHTSERTSHENFHHLRFLQSRTDQLMARPIEDRSNPLKKLNNSLSHIKMNIRKYRSRHDLSESSFLSDSTMVNDSNRDELEHLYQPQNHLSSPPPSPQKSQLHPMKSVMRKMIKVAGDRRNNKVLL